MHCTPFKCSLLVLDQHVDVQRLGKEEIDDSPKRTKMVSSIALNIPAAGLGSRPASVVSTSTADEGGFNEPSPEIKAKLRPHEDTLFTFSPSDTGIIQQKSIDSDVMYHTSNTAITNSVLAELESKENEESEIMENNKKIETSKNQSVLEPLFVQTCSKTNAHEPLFATNKHKDCDSEVLLLSKCDKSNFENDDCKEILSDSKTVQSVTDGGGFSKIEEPEIFLVSRTALNDENGLNSFTHTESLKSEASILDLQDVEYADASDEETNPYDLNQRIAETETMTQAEADNLLSSRYVHCYIFMVVL